MEARKTSRPSILEARKRSRSSILTNNGVTLPDDLIIAILSRLPVKSVVRFKCVCKSWLIITHQKYFIEKHKSRSQIIYKYEQIYDEKYVYTNSVHGLVLERNFKTRLYRIRNPATKQVLQVTSQVFERIHSNFMCFDPSSNMYKLINIYKKEGTSYLGVCMLTIGSDDEHAWRDLNVNLLFGRWSRLLYIYHKDVSYIATYCFDELEKTDILRLPIDGKSFMKIKVPQNFHMVPDIYSSHELQMFILGDEKLSIGFMIRHILYVWVLENYEKNIWSEKKIISLDYFKDCKGIITVHPSPNLNKLRLTIDNIYVEYDVHSKTYICLAEAPPGMQILDSITPSLVSLKGMRYESEDP